jgi:tetraacyldisaccharide 4'-kinase
MATTRRFIGCSSTSDRPHTLADVVQHRWLERVWYAGAASGAWLVPFGWLFAALAALRRALYRSGMLPSFGVGIPVVVVGNLTVGGTGKTPLVIWLVEELARRGLRPGVVTRGHGGSTRRPTIVATSMSAADCGDEPLLIALRTRRTVVVARDRVAGARLLAECGADVVIADDGLQHYRLRRNCEIVVIDGERRFGNGRLLPAGPLREPLARLATVDAVAVNGGAAKAGELPMRLVSGRVRSLTDGGERALDSFAGGKVHAVAAIGNPRRFFDGLRRAGLTLIEHAFADHHAFRAADLEFAEAGPVLMTEKDAVKCRAFAREGWWAVPVSAHFEPPAAQALIDRVLARIREPLEN